MFCYESFKHFRVGRNSVGEILTSGRTSTSTKDDDVEKILAVIRGNRHLTLQEFSDEVGIGIGSCHQIFTEEVHMRDVSAKFLPLLLTDDQKDSRVEISQKLLDNANYNENILMKIVTMNESWVYLHDVETKMQSSQCMVIGSPRPKARISRSKTSVFLVAILDWKGIVQYEFAPRGRVENKQLFQDILAHLREAVGRKKPELWENGTWIFHTDNAQVHASLLICIYLAKYQMSVVPLVPYSLDLAPADYFFFPIHKLH